jgi:ParB-like chromosome segregation protein Spo0J
VAKAKEKLPPIPKPRKGRATAASAQAPAPVPNAAPTLADLSHGLTCGIVSIADLHFHPKNPRKHSEKNIAGIRASLRVNGQYRRLIASDRTGKLVVVVGNGLLAAALAEGWKFLDVGWKRMSAGEENQRLVTDNETALLAEWDNDVLKAAYRDLDTGNDEDLDAMLAELATDLKLVPADDPPGDQPPKPPSEWDVVVECPSEDRQKELIEQLGGEGWKCQARSR